MDYCSTLLGDASAAERIHKLQKRAARVITYSPSAKKLGHASLATVFRPSLLTFQPIPRENLESPVSRHQPITTAGITDACLNTIWHHGALYITERRHQVAALRESLGLDRVVTVYVV